LTQGLDVTDEFILDKERGKGGRDQYFFRSNLEKVEKEIKNTNKVSINIDYSMD